MQAESRTNLFDYAEAQLIFVYDTKIQHPKSPLSANVRQCPPTFVFVCKYGNYSLYLHRYSTIKILFSMFTPRTYLKSELAMLYAPDSCIDTAVKNLYRWIQHCQPLCRDLERMNYNPRRKHFMKREVEAIVHHLGEP